MLDGWARRKIEPAVDALARQIVRSGISANAMTLAAFALGLFSAFAVAHGLFLTGLALLLASRLGDGLDGALARLKGKTDFGGFLDIVLDFGVYGAIPLGFAFADPTANALAAAALIASFYVNGASFLAFSVLAEKNRLATEIRGQKSIYFTTGLAEAGETLAIFTAACLFPAAFPWLAWSFAGICLYTALSRIMLARRTFG